MVWTSWISESIRSWCVFDVAGKSQEIARLEKKATEPDFWSAPESAQATMRKLAMLREEVEAWQGLSQRVTDGRALLELAIADSDEALGQEIAAEVEKVAADLERFEFQLLLSGEHDGDDAILAIHAGAGGTEAQDWAEMLLRMYVRWAEKRDYRADILDFLAGEEAGLKNVTVAVSGPYAYGYLKAERGVHRLVRLSPFDATHRRHTSFALIEVMPDIAEDIEID
ncbi:MAG: PCRF domain-containing protein, partial [Anaerolineae bacterium]